MDVELPQVVPLLYKSPWLNQCAEVLCKPKSSLDEVTKKIVGDLPSTLESHFRNSRNEQQRQVTYRLLGYPFVSSHFPISTFGPECWEQTPDSSKIPALEECKASISEHLERIIERNGFDRPLSRYSRVSPLGSFLATSQEAFKEGLDHWLHVATRVKTNKQGSSRLVKYVQEKDENINVWEKEEDVMGEALVEVCHHEANRTAAVVKAFGDSCFPLPAPLRQFLFKEYLMGNEKKQFKDKMSLAAVEAAVTSNFAKTLHRRAPPGQDIRSPVWQQINEAVTEMYSRVSTLRAHNTEDRQREAINVLNALQLYNKLFNPTLVLWLFPLQLAFANVGHSTESHLMEMAMLLDLVTKHCVPNTDWIFNVADRVTSTWKACDQITHGVVCKALQKDVTINIKDFPAQVLHVYKSEANKIYVRLKGKSQSDIPREHFSIVTDPVIFVRKWIAEGFVSTVGFHALLFIWDQLLIRNWSEQAFCNVCLTIIFLLKSRLLKAKDYFAVREIFVSAPGRLYTEDIRNAYGHVVQGKDFNLIANMNRNLSDDGGFGSGESRSRHHF